MSLRIAKLKSSITAHLRSASLPRNSSEARGSARLILATAIAALVPTITHAADTVRTWDIQDNNGGTTPNNNFYNNLNWDGDVRPTFGGNSDAYLFNGTGAAVVLNINGGLTEYLVKNFTFTAGAYTFTGMQNLTFGDATTSALNTGILRNNSSGTQAFNNSSRIAFNFGAIDAAAGNITFGANTVIDIGNGSSAAGRSLAVTGNFNTTINGVLAGAGTDTSEGGALTKTGNGTLLLQAESSSWAGRIQVDAGTVRINKGLALGSASGRTFIAGESSTAKVEFNSSISVPENFVLGGRSNGSTAPHLANFGGNNTLTGTIQLDAGGTAYGFDSAAGTLTVNGAIQYGTGSGASTLSLGGAGNGVINGVIGSPGDAIGITKVGAGTWTLNAANNFTGPVDISSGRLNISTRHAGGGTITVSDGATLGVTVTSPGETLRTSTLTLGGNGSASLSFDLGNFGGPTVPVITAGTFSTGSTAVSIRGNLSVGQFPLIDYTAPIGGAGFAGLTLASLPARATGSLVHDLVNTQILLNITAFDIPRWTGAVNNDWDFDESSGPGLTGTANWKEITSGSTTRYLQGQGSNDSVVFDDTAPSTATNVNLTTVLTPTTVTVNNSALDYTFTGNGGLSGSTAIIKQGTGKLILANLGVNDYSGTTTINAGSTVQIGDGVTEAAGSIGSGAVINNGTLVLNRPDAYSLSAPVSGNGSIVKLTAGTTTISGNNSFNGALTVSAGTLKLGNANALGSTTGGTTIAAGAALDAGGQRTPAGEIITISGSGVFDNGALINTGTGNLNVGFRNVVLAGPATFGGTTRFDIRDNPGGLDAAGHALTKVGANSIFLANLGETHIGDLLLTSGRIAFEGNTTLGDQPGTVRVEEGAELGLEDSIVAHTKPILLKSGTINVTSGTGNRLGGTITLEGSGNFRTATNTTATIAGVITGDGDLAKQAAGILILAADNQYTGRTIVTQGTLRVGNDGVGGSVGSGDISLEPASGQTATLAFRRSDSSLIVTNEISSPGSGTNVLNIGAVNGVVPATAIITLSGVNSFTGAVNVNGGSLRITNSSALGLGPKTVTVASNTKPSLRLNATDAPIDLAADLSLVTSNDDVNFPAILNEVGNNTIRGNIALNTGNGGNTRVTVNDGTSLTLAGAIAPASTSTANRTLFVDGGGTGVISGIISDLTGTPSRTLSLTKSGTGTWTLDAANTYTGPTTIQTGTLKLGSAASIASSSQVNVAANATLDVSAISSFALGANQLLSGTGSIKGNLTDATGATISPGGSGGTGTLTFANDLSLTGGGKLQLNLGANGTSDLISIAGKLSLAGVTAVDLLPTGAPLSPSYRLFSYAGELSGTAANLTLSHKARYNFALDTSKPNEVNLQVTGSAANLTWSGDGAGNVWNTASAQNWNAGTEKFYDVDSVLFNDSTTNTEITVEGTVIPNQVHVNSSRDFTLLGSGRISGAPGGLVKEGNGTLSIATANDYTGPTEIIAGSLIINGSINGSAVTVHNGGTLGGNGTITTGNQPFTIEAGAHLSPDNLTINTGTASLDLSTALAGSGLAALLFDLVTPTTSDRITLSGGTLNIGTGVLGFDDFAFTDLSGFGNGTYTLIQTNSPIIGTLDSDPLHLSGLVGGQTATLAFGDNGTDLVLTVVPEPATGTAILAAAVGLLGFRRRRTHSSMSK